MKDKVNQFMEKCKQNKKKAALGVVLLFFLLVALGAGVYSLNNENEPVQKVAKTERQTKEEKKGQEDLKKTEEEEKDEKESKVTTSETEKKKEEKKASEEKKEDAQKSADTQAAKAETEKATEKKASNEKTTEASKPASQPVASTPVASEPVVSNPVVSEPVTSKPTHTHDYQPVYTQKWVVDQAAWTETVETPVYGQDERSICNGCGADITGNTRGHIESSLISGGNCGGYHSEWIKIQTGTTTQTIEHPEQGHNEDVIAYHQCSCGATK